MNFPMIKKKIHTYMCVCILYIYMIDVTNKQTQYGMYFFVSCSWDPITIFVPHFVSIYVSVASLHSAIDENEKI